MNSGAVCVEIFLPLRDGDGRPFPRAVYDELKSELVEAFGGVTVFSRSPAEGLWDDGGAIDRDQIVIFEVMAERLDERWWARLRGELEETFRQKEIVVRAHPIKRL